MGMGKRLNTGEDGSRELENRTVFALMGKITVENGGKMGGDRAIQSLRVWEGGKKAETG